MDKRITLVVILLISLFSAGVMAATDTDIITFDLEVASIVDINVTPTTYNFSGAGTWYPGNTTSATNFTVENIGSVNVTSFYAYSTMPSSRPFGTGDPSDFDVGNFIELSNDSGSNYWYANRVEFNESDDATVTYPASHVAYGKFRIGMEEYKWALVNGTYNCTNGTIYIGTNTTDNDLTDNSMPTLTPQSSGDYGAVDAGASPTALDDYCILVHRSCTNVTIVHWNQGSTPWDTDSTCSNDGKLYTGQLAPGDSQDIDVRAQIPLGTTAGTITQGTVTVSASD